MVLLQSVVLESAGQRWCAQGLKMMPFQAGQAIFGLCLLLQLLPLVNGYTADPLEASRWLPATISAGPLTGVAFGNGRLVAVGQQATLLTSRDGTNWTPAPMEKGSSFYVVHFGQGIFVAAGSKTDGAGGSKPILGVSTDGLSWSNRVVAPESFSAITFGRDLFVAGGVAGHIYSSQDASSWRRGQRLGLRPITALAFGNGIFLAITQTNIWRSIDGVLWSPTYTLQENQALTGLAYGSGRFIAVGSLGLLLTSADGLVWSEEPIWVNRSWTAVTFGGGRFVVVGRDGVLVSADGSVWTGLDWASGAGIPILQGAWITPLSVVFGPEQFIAVGSQVGNQGFILNSSDGFRWRRAFGVTTRSLRAITFSKDRFVAVGDHASILQSKDGVHWIPSLWKVDQRTLLDFDATNLMGPTLLPHSGLGIPLLDITYAGDQFVAIAPRITGGRWGTYLLRSPDALNWTALILNERLTSVDFLYDRFFAAGSGGAILWSSDAIQWSRANSPVTNHLSKVIFGHGIYLALGEKGTILRSTDGTNWLPVNSGSTNWLKAGALGKGRYVVGGERGTLLASVNGINWSQLQPPALPAHIHSLSFANDVFVAAGHSGLILTSLDGKIWQATALGDDAPLYDVTYNRGKFVAVGGRGIWSADLHQPLLRKAISVEGRFAFQLFGRSDKLYRIQTTTRLAPADWSDVKIHPGYGGIRSYSEPLDKQAPARYYRAVLHGE